PTRGAECTAACSRRSLTSASATRCDGRWMLPRSCRRCPCLWTSCPPRGLATGSKRVPRYFDSARPPASRGASSQAKSDRSFVEAASSPSPIVADRAARTESDTPLPGGLVMIEHLRPEGLYPSERLGFTQVVTATPGRLAWIAGQTACDVAGRPVGGRDI